VGTLGRCSNARRIGTQRDGLAKRAKRAIRIVVHVELCELEQKKNALLRSRDRRDPSREERGGKRSVSRPPRSM
jgi:hypothetical protein